MSSLFARFASVAWVGVAVSAALGHSAALAQSADRVAGDSGVQEFLANYCTDCHGADETKGDRRFDTLAASIRSDNDLVDYQDIVDQLNLGDMPPPDADQPSDDLRMKIISRLGETIAQYHASRVDTGGDTVLRRLNAREYLNSVRDLFKLNTTLFDPTRNFPADQTVDHLDNVGDALVTSSHLMVRYLEAAEAVIAKALYPLDKPEQQTWTFRGGFKQQREIDAVHRAVNGWKHMTLYDAPGADKPEGAFGPILAFADGVPHDGIYEIRFRAEALNRLHPYDDRLVGTDRDQPFRLGIVPGDQTAGQLHVQQPVQPLLAEVALQDAPTWYTVRVWLDRGYTPRFTFQNGLMDARNLWTKLIRRYPDQFPKDIEGIVQFRRNAIEFGKLPQIRIHEIEIEGPLLERWPKASQTALLGEDFVSLATTETLDLATVRKHVARFARRAYRRPATESEVESILSLIRSRHLSGRLPIDSVADGMTAILCSPNFLYLDESTGVQSQTTGATSASPATTTNRLEPHALAARLSYFLWSSTPDDELLALADSGALVEPEILDAQVRRMLADERSEAMVSGFLDSWLGLRELGSAPPDRGRFRDYYRYDLGTAMRTETQVFFRYLLDQNLGLGNLIDSDFTFVNRPLAKLYDVSYPKAQGNEFCKVRLDDDRRGGILGQASVLTVSANGIDTSPVVRGVWMLESFLGTPPSPPPPDVEPLDPDTRGAKTIRDQLAKHRSSATCNDCHRKIDPLGFALETYDAIGRWREKYERGPKIDPHGELPDGQSFAGIGELKKILMGRRELIARSLVEKMLAYSTGRQTVPSDRAEVDRIVDSATGLRDVIELLVQSESFLSP